MNKQSIPTSGIQDDIPPNLPLYATKGAAGADVYAAIEQSILLDPGKRVLVPTGIRCEIPPNYEIQIRPRSGLAFKHGVTILNTPATIDSDYRGEIKVLLINLGESPFEITPNMRIAQLVVAKVEQVVFEPTSSLHFFPTSRGEQGFGHTGIK